VGTIEGHLVKGIREGEIELKEVLPEKISSEIAAVFLDDESISLGAAYNKLDGKYSWDYLRMVQASMEK